LKQTVLNGSCIVCASRELEFLFRTWDRHYGIEGEYELGRCRQCGFIFLDPMLSEQQLEKLYPSGYYSYQPVLAHKSWFRKIAKRLFRMPIPTHDPAFPTPGTLLDLGCGSGEYLLKMRERGWRVFGVEPNRAAAIAGQKAGLEIFHGTLTQARLPSEFFDYVRANHSLEHMPNPHQILAEISRILRPDGKLFVGVPNSASVLFRLFKQYWWHLCAPVHVCGYSLRTLRLILSRHGFRVTKTYFSSNYVSVLGSIQIFANRKKRVPADQGRLLKSPLFIPPCHIAARVLDVFKAGDTIEVICERP
jgi:SAM-dependent methyltransferase